MSDSLAALPSISSLLTSPAIQQLVSEHSLLMVKHWMRKALDGRRAELLKEGAHTGSRPAELQQLVEAVRKLADSAEVGRVRRVVNATGVVLHTGLGRAPLSSTAIDAVVASARCTNLELNLADGQRRYRGYQIVEKLQVLTGCEDALIVNNNAAATLLTLQSLAHGPLPHSPWLQGSRTGGSPESVDPGSPREVVISRGQMIEIGGSFRLPEIFELSGIRMREIGTTNRTRPEDYVNAIHAQTAAVLRVHPSNYQVTGFAQTPDIHTVCAAVRPLGVPVIDDIGSGCLTDMRLFGLPSEPAFSESITAGASIVLGSGDKLLGGPQCGIIIGSAHWIERMRQHPLARVVRIDKLTLAALDATLDAYLHQQSDSLIVHQLLSAEQSELRRRAEKICNQFTSIDHGNSDEWTVEVRDETAEVGGGSLPGATLPTAVIRLTAATSTAHSIATRLRTGNPAIVPRIQEESVIVDFRSISKDELPLVLSALTALLTIDA